MNYTARGKEFRSTVRTGIMVHRCFGEATAIAMKLVYQLNANGAAGNRKLHWRDCAPSNQTEVTVNVADRKKEKQTCQAIIKPAENFALPAVCAFYLKTIDYVNLRRQKWIKNQQFKYVILSVPIRIKDEIFLGRGKAAAQGGPISLVTRMMNYPHFTVRF